MGSVTAAISAAILVSTASAATIDYVTTTANTFYGGTSNVYDSITGLSQHPGPGTEVFTSNPTTNITGLSSAFTKTQAQATDTQNGVTSYATAYAYADLATGLLGVSAGGYCTPPNPNCAGEAFGEAVMRDDLTFDNTTGQTQDIGVTFRFDGVISGSNRQAVAIDLCFINSSFCPNGDNFTFNVGTIFGPAPPTSSAPISGWVSTSVTINPNDTSGQFYGVFAVPAGRSTDFLSASMQADCGQDGTSCDFSHTGALSLTLPGGVGFTSTSGVLLTETVPEPAAGCLAIAGFCAVLLGCRRRRRSG